MSEKLDCQRLYEGYISQLEQGDIDVKYLHFEMPLVQTYSIDCVQLRALMDKDKDLYRTTIPGFEYELLLMEGHDSTHYQELIKAYRQGYFRFQNRNVNNVFYLKQADSSTNLHLLTQQYLLEDDDTVVEFLLNHYQSQLNDFEMANSNNTDFAYLRKEEAQMLLGFRQEFLSFTRLVKITAQHLNELLSDFKIKTIDPNSFALKGAFQKRYKLLDRDELSAYLSTAQEISVRRVHDDVEALRGLTQTQILNNIIEAEAALNEATANEIEGILKCYAAKEQESVSLYRSLIRHYFSLTQAEEDFTQVHKPFEMYFDNYFADFEHILAYYAHVYKDQDIDPLTSPYYRKIYTVTHAKITITNKNYIEMMQESKAAYIRERDSLTQLTLLKHEYAQEVDSLFDEFQQFGIQYISAITDTKGVLVDHENNVSVLKEKYDLRGKNEFF